MISRIKLKANDISWISRGLVSKELWCCVGGEWKRMFGFINGVDKVQLAAVKRFECFFIRSDISIDFVNFFLRL